MHRHTIPPAFPRLRQRLLTGLLLALGCSLWSPAALLAQISVQGLGFLPGYASKSSAIAVSADGSVVVGESKDGSDNFMAFRWTSGSGMVSLSPLAGYTMSSGDGVNSDGSVVVGASYNDGQLGASAYRWTQQGGMVSLGAPSSPYGYAVNTRGVSGNGAVIVGFSYNSNTSAAHAFRWTQQSGMTDLGTLSGGDQSNATAVSSDGATVVGNSNSSSTNFRAVRWTSGEGGVITDLGVLGSDAISEAYAVSSDGSVIVGYSGADYHNTQAFRWTQDGMVGLGKLNGLSTYAYGVSGDGRVVVGETEVNGVPSGAFYWTGATGIQSLYDYVSATVNLSGSGWTSFTSAGAISADGSTIVGYGTHNGASEAFVISGLNFAAVPEPSTYAALFGALALAAALVLRRRRRQVTP